MSQKTQTPTCCAPTCCSPAEDGQLGATPDAIRAQVRSSYGQVAAAAGSDAVRDRARELSTNLGYGGDALDEVPADANLGLGCGNPGAIAALEAGATVLDLGSGGGLDAFLAARQVGPTGRVIGVDMTPEMLALSRRNAVQADLHGQVEFREGQIEALPVVDASIDVVMSNCVVSLSPNKDAVFAEAFRVLKPGGRMQLSDIVLEAPLPEDFAQRADAWAGCVGGASLKADYLGAIEGAGFEIVGYSKTPAGQMLADAACGCAGDPLAAALIDDVGLDRLREIAETVYSYKIEARRPQ